MRGRRFQSKCLSCDWFSRLCTSVVIAGNLGSSHVKVNHPNSEGFVAVILEVNSVSLDKHSTPVNTFTNPTKT